MTAQIRGVESGMPASRLEANVCYLGLTPKPLGLTPKPPKPDPEAAKPEDRKGFLLRFGKVCACHGWRVHAWMLMDNHFYLLVETL